jgi:hypothetical protein
MSVAFEILEDFIPTNFPEGNGLSRDALWPLAIRHEEALYFYVNV